MLELALDSLSMLLRVLLLALMLFRPEHCINYNYYGQVVLNTRGILEQRACLDTLLALLVDCSENLTVRSARRTWKWNTFNLLSTVCLLILLCLYFL
jgi:hypothetical protein